MGEGGQRHLILIDVDYRVARQQWAVGPEPDPPVAVAVDPPSGDVFWRCTPGEVQAEEYAPHDLPCEPATSSNMVRVHCSADLSGSSPVITKRST